MWLGAGEAPMATLVAAPCGGALGLALETFPQSKPGSSETVKPYQILAVRAQPCLNLAFSSSINNLDLPYETNPIQK